MQFALEEGYGYFDDPVFVDATTSRQAAALRDDHKTLYQEISSIADWVEEMRHNGFLSNEMPRVKSRFECFCDQLNTHEKREQDLIMAGYCDDIGTGD